MKDSKRKGKKIINKEKKKQITTKNKYKDERKIR